MQVLRLELDIRGSAIGETEKETEELRRALYKRLNDLDYTVVEMCNAGIDELRAFERTEKKGFKAKFIEENKREPEKGEYPKFSLYNFYRENYPEMNTRIINCVARTIEKKWKEKVRACFYAHKETCPTYKQGFPIPFPEANSFITKEEGGLYFSAHLVNVHGKRPPYTKLLIKSPFVFNGKKRFEDKSKTQILERILDGTYKRGETRIKKDGKKWFLLIAYEPGKKTVALDVDKVSGVDQGVIHTFYQAFSGDSYNRFCPTDSDQIWRFRCQMENRRKSIQRSVVFSRRTGKGIKRKFAPLEKLRKIEGKFQDDKFHKYSSKIVQKCLEFGCGTIQLENLKDFKKEDKSWLLKNWAISSFEEKLKYKAEMYGIQIVEVDPGYTSQRCPECGHISSENRKTQKDFKCVSCGYEENADFVGARNLSVPFIDVLIAKQVGLVDKLKEDPKMKPRLDKLTSRIEEFEKCGGKYSNLLKIKELEEEEKKEGARF